MTTLAHGGDATFGRPADDESSGGDPSSGTTASSLDGGTHDAGVTTDEPATTSTGELPSGSSDATTSAGSLTDGGTTTDDASSTGAVVDTVDLSGWTIVQTDSARELQLPPGTIVPVGGAVVVVRGATAPAFAAFWGFAWDETLVFVDGAANFPSINGAETFGLRDDVDALVDGPSPALDAETAYVRVDADTAGDVASAWQVVADPNANVMPGASSASGGTRGVPYLAQIVDAVGNGNYIYEFVEIRVAP